MDAATRESVQRDGRRLVVASASGNDNGAGDSSRVRRGAVGTEVEQLRGPPRGGEVTRTKYPPVTWLRLMICGFALLPPMWLNFSARSNSPQLNYLQIESSCLPEFHSEVGGEQLFL
jgi:hypothetical protein